MQDLSPLMDLNGFWHRMKFIKCYVMFKSNCKLNFDMIKLILACTSILLNKCNFKDVYHIRINFGVRLKG